MTKPKAAATPKPAAKGIRIQLKTAYRRRERGKDIRYEYGDEITVTKAELKQFPHLGDRVK